MKTPDQNNLPQNKNKAEQTKQQPKIPKEAIKGILAGIGSLPAIKAIGEKMRGPRADESKSKALQKELDEKLKKHDSSIAIAEQIRQTISQNNQPNAQFYLDSLDNDIKTIKSEKDSEIKSKSDQLKVLKRQEKDDFIKANPEHHEKILADHVNKQTKRLNNEYKNASNDNERNQIKSEMDILNQKYAFALNKLTNYKIDNEKQKFESQAKSKTDKLKNFSENQLNKIDERIKDENDLKNFDLKALEIANATLFNLRQEDKKSNQQKSIIKDDESKIITDTRKERLEELENENIANELKLDQEVEAKKNRVGMFDKLKSSVTINLGNAQTNIKAKIKENDNAKLNAQRDDRTSAERMSNAVQKVNGIGKKAFEFAKAKINENDLVKTNIKPKENIKSNIQIEINPVLANVNTNNVNLKEKIDNEPENAAEANMDEQSQIAKNKAMAQKQIETLTGKHQQDLNILKKKIAKINKSKNNKEYEKVRKQINKLENDFNESISIQRSILEDN